MKLLKIEDNRGSYSLDGQSWKQIDEIDKNDMLSLLEHALTENFEMDTFEAASLGNQAHRIIYQHLHEKFLQLQNNRSRFKDESEALYKDAIEAYSA